MVQVAGEVVEAQDDSHESNDAYPKKVQKPVLDLKTIPLHHTTAVGN